MATAAEWNMHDGGLGTGGGVSPMAAAGVREIRDASAQLRKINWRSACCEDVESEYDEVDRGKEQEVESKRDGAKEIESE